jgi:23S rRNA (pseudouridine1915-N3)-methyltransferase
MKILILCFGKLDEKFYQQASAEYCKRLQHYCDLKIVELKEEFRYELPRNQTVNSETLNDYLQSLKGYEICLLDVNGQMVDSQQFANLI